MKAQAQSLLLEGKESGAETIRQEIFASQPGLTLYRTNKRDLLIQEFTAPAGPNGRKKGGTRDSGVLRNLISTYLFEYLKGFHVATHFLGARPGAEMLVKSAEPVPLLVRIFNVAEDDWPERFGMPAAAHLEFPVIEHYLAGTDRAPALVNEYHCYALNLLKPDELKQINRLGSKVNAVLRGLCERRELAPADLKLSFGRYNNQIILTGELSPATIRFLDASPARRKGNGAALPVDTQTDEGLEGLYGRLKLNG